MAGNNRQHTEELNDILLPTVAQLLGFSLPQRGSTNCPFPDHDDSNPSFEVKPQHNRWICYGCNRKGGAIDLVKEYLNKDFLSAKQWLAERADKTSTNRNTSKHPLPKPSKTDAKLVEKPESSPDDSLYEKLISLCPLDTRGFEYLTRRAISENTIANFRVGQLDRPSSVVKVLLEQFGFNRVKKSGVLTKHSTEEDCRLVFSQDSIIFPFIEDGRVVYLQARYIGSANNRAKWMNLNGRHHRIYNVETLSNAQSEKVSICEGIIDTFSAIELGFDAIGLMGVSAAFTADQIKQLKGKQVDILLDWDEQGNKRANALQNELKKYGVVSTRKMRPSPATKDLNEYLVETRGIV